MQASRALGFTIVLGPTARTTEPASDETIDTRIGEELARGRRAKDIAEALAIETGRSKREVYARVLAKRVEKPPMG